MGPSVVFRHCSVVSSDAWKYLRGSLLGKRVCPEVRALGDHSGESHFHGVGGGSCIQTSDFQVKIAYRQNCP